VGNSFSYN